MAYGEQSENYGNQQPSQNGQGYQANQAARGHEQQGQAGGQQLLEQVVQALQQGAQPKDVVAALVQKGMPEAQATDIVNKVSQRLQGGDSNAVPEGSEAKQSLSAEQALEVLSSLDTNAETIIQIIKVVLNMNAKELGRLLGLLNGEGVEGQAQESGEQSTEQPY